MATVIEPARSEGARPSRPRSHRPSRRSSPGSMPGMRRSTTASSRGTSRSSARPTHHGSGSRRRHSTARSMPSAMPHVPFTIQSISKPLTYALVLDDQGEAAVRAKIGVEPTGDAFNAITLDRASGRPLNPMVNAGAITAAGMLRPVGSETDLERILDGMRGSPAVPCGSTTRWRRPNAPLATATARSGTSCAPLESSTGRRRSRRAVLRPVLRRNRRRSTSR